MATTNGTNGKTVKQTKLDEYFCSMESMGLSLEILKAAHEGGAEGPKFADKLGAAVAEVIENAYYQGWKDRKESEYVQAFMGGDLGWQRGMDDAATEMDAYASVCGSNLAGSIRTAANRLRAIAKVRKQLDSDRKELDK